MSFNNSKTLITGFLALMLATAAQHSFADEVKLIAANAVKESVTEIMGAYEKASGHKISATWGGTDAIAKRVGSGEVFDVVIIAGPNIDKLALDGKIVQGSKTDFAKSGVGVAVRSGLQKPDISSSDAVKRAVLNAKSIAYSSGPSGAYIVELLKKLGVSDQIKDRVKQPASGVQVGELIARGEADIGFQQVSELMNVKGIEFLGPLPADIQNITVYSAGLHASAPSREAAKAFMTLLTSAQSAPIIKHSGMDPAN